MKGTQIPLFGRIVFVDWHGVLSNEPFWSSILSAPTHPLKLRLGSAVARVFAQNGASECWMKGNLNSVEVINQMGMSAGGKFGQKFIAKRLIRDCASMNVDLDLFKLLNEVRALAPVVLATDNMDCFSAAFNLSANGARRRSAKRSLAPRLHEWAQICDGIVCSSDVGVLKSENPEAFFKSTLVKYGLEFRHAVLIDDREDNCLAFRSMGGKAIAFKTGRDDISKLTDDLCDWLGWPRQVKGSDNYNA